MFLSYKKYSEYTKYGPPSLPGCSCTPLKLQQHRPGQFSSTISIPASSTHLPCAPWVFPSPFEHSTCSFNPSCTPCTSHKLNIDLMTKIRMNCGSPFKISYQCVIDAFKLQQGLVYVSSSASVTMELQSIVIKYTTRTIMVHRSPPQSLQRQNLSTGYPSLARRQPYCTYPGHPLQTL